MTPQQAIELLKIGNTRFVNGTTKNNNYKEQIKNISSLQNPFAIMISCMDSRIPISAIFDQKIGSIFNICIAGNFINKDITASLELACTNSNIHLILVMGHNDCNAIKNACNEITFGKAEQTLPKIKPAITAIEKFSSRDAYSEKQFIQKVTYKNIELTTKNIKENSFILKKKIQAQEILIIGAMYDIYTGYVEIFH